MINYYFVFNFQHLACFMYGTRHYENIFNIQFIEELNNI